MSRKLSNGEKVSKKFHVFPNHKRISNTTRALNRQIVGAVLRDFSDPPQLVEQLEPGRWVVPGSTRRYTPTELVALSTDLGWVKLWPLTEENKDNQEITALYAGLEEQRSQDA